MTLNQFALLAFIVCGPAAIGFGILWWRVERRAARARWPIQELPRRPAGESSRLKIESINEKLMGWMMMFVGWPIVFLVISTYRPIPSLVGMGLAFVVGAIVTTVTLFKIWSLLSDLRNYILGFEGERYAAGFLDELMRDGFEVFHDVPFTTFNIDHVLVGPRGVFAVETKTRRKNRSAGKGFEWKVSFTGDALEFPWGRDTFGIEQAARNAGTLRQWIFESTREKVSVQPVLLLPGWMVERKGRDAVMVANPKEARGIFLKDGPTLSPDAVGRIAFQLRQKSRIELGK
jgi:hypothetical protein